jgi:hypothetical protein
VEQIGVRQESDLLVQSQIKALINGYRITCREVLLARGDQGSFVEYMQHFVKFLKRGPSFFIELQNITVLIGCVGIECTTH